MYEFTRIITNCKPSRFLPDRRSVLRWAIDQLIKFPYRTWVSRIVDRLLMAIEGGTENV